MYNNVSRSFYVMNSIFYGKYVLMSMNNTSKPSPFVLIEHYLSPHKHLSRKRYLLNDFLFVTPSDRH